MYRIFLFVVFVIGLSACSNETKEPNTASKAKAENTATAPTQKQPLKVTLPSVPKELMLELWEKADYTDVIFYKLDFSISQDNQMAVRNMVQSISPVAAPLDPSCEAIGRIFYQIKGEVAAECDLFFSRDCAHVVFYEDGKQKYANYLSDAGVKFFKQIFDQVKAGQGQ